MNTRTSIALAPATKDLRARFGAKSESFDHIIRRLIEEAGWARQEAKWSRILDEDEFIPLANL